VNQGEFLGYSQHSGVGNLATIGEFFGYSHHSGVSNLAIVGD